MWRREAIELPWLPGTDKRASHWSSGSSFLGGTSCDSQKSECKLLPLAGITVYSDIVTITLAIGVRPHAIDRRERMLVYR